MAALSELLELALGGMSFKEIANAKGLPLSFVVSTVWEDARDSGQENLLRNIMKYRQNREKEEIFRNPHDYERVYPKGLMVSSFGRAWFEEKEIQIQEDSHNPFFVINNRKYLLARIMARCFLLITNTSILQKARFIEKGNYHVSNLTILKVRSNAIIK